MSSIIINADDFGISKGVNSAIKQMFNEKRLNSVSIFTKAKYTQDAIDFCLQNKEILPGLHFNLTTGPSVLGHSELPTLTDSNGNFKFGFIGLLLITIIKKNVLIEIKKELIAQLNILNQLSVKHIDGHRHIHVIPRIFSIVKEVVEEYKIPRVRIINENPLTTFLQCRNLNFLLDGGLIKLIILRLCGLFNNYNNKSHYFFSILHTCKITNDLTKSLKIPKGYDCIEVMIHPGNTEIDKNEEILYEKDHLLSEHRNLESKLIIRL